MFPALLTTRSRCWALALLIASTAPAGQAAPGPSARRPGTPGSPVSVALPTPPRDFADLGAALAGLAANSAEERRLAQRWVARHAVTTDFPALAEAARDGDPEVRARIAAALGTDGRHLALAALFAAEEPAELRAVGETALHELLLAWNADLETCREVEGDVEVQLREAGLELPEELMRLDLAGVLSDVVDRLLRTGAAGVPVVVDTDVDELRFTRAVRDPLGRAVFEGTWLDLLMLSARLRNLDLEAVGLPSDEGLPVFLRFGTARSAGDHAGAELFARWTRELVAGTSYSKRLRAARALGATGWPPAIAWLEALWTERGDRAALEGLLLAAGRGRVAPFLAEPDEVRALVAGVDEVLAGRDQASGDLRHANAVLHALTNLSSLGRGGTDLCELLLPPASERSRLTPAQLWFRLALVAGQGSASREVRASVAEILGAAPGEHLPAVLRQALRTWVALPPPERGGAAAEALQLGNLPGLLRWSIDGPAARRTAEDLVRSGATPPAGAYDLGTQDDRVVLAGLTVCEWNLGVGRVEAAAEALLELDILAPGWPAPIPTGAVVRDISGDLPPAVEDHRLQGAAAEILRDWARRGHAPRVEALLAHLREREESAGRSADEPGAVDRLALLAGLLPPTERDRVEVFVLAQRGAGDGVALGTLAALPGGEVASEALREALRQSVEQSTSGLRAAELGAGLARALDDLRARGADAEAVELHGDLLGIARRHPEAPLAGTVLDPRWPPSPGTRPDDLDAMDSSFGRLFGELQRP